MVCNVFVVVEGRSMDYSEVSAAFSSLVETHFLQRCPQLGGAAMKEGTTPADAVTPAAPAAPASTAPPTAESFSDCYKVPQVTLIGRGKRQLASDDGEDQRNAKRPRMDSEVGLEHYGYFKLISCINSSCLFCPLTSDALHLC